MRHSVRVYSKDILKSVPALTMREELENIELYGGEIGERNNADYMFPTEKDIDMDAFCDRFISRLEVGTSTDATTYFDKLNSRLGIKCREEVSASSPAPSPVPAEE